jgi:hypothetical protein
MRHRLLIAAFATFAVLGLSETASAQVYCFNPAPFGNVYRVTVIALGPQFLLTGVENVFADRTIIGAVAVGVNQPGTYRLGFTVHAVTATATDLQVNAVLSAATGNGTYVAWADTTGVRQTGNLNMVSCAGVPDELRGLPDISESLKQP